MICESCGKNIKDPDDVVYFNMRFYHRVIEERNGYLHFDCATALNKSVGAILQGRRDAEEKK